MFTLLETREESTNPQYRTSFEHETHLVQEPHRFVNQSKSLDNAESRKEDLKFEI